ncbi:MAG TPA: hypothetical protein VGD21_07210 [Lysobacter sp.]
MTSRLLLPLATVMLLGCHAGTQQLGAKPVPAAADGSPCQGQDPTRVVRSFYDAYIASDGSGLPSTNEMSVYAPMFSQGLVDAIERARVEQQDFIRQHPDEKPPYIEGSLFGSLFEGITALESVAMKPDGAQATLAVALVYDDKQNAPVRWKDDVLLRCERGQWRIDDVEYHGGWDFAPRGRLREELESP